MSEFIDVTGMRFGRLTATEYVGPARTVGQGQTKSVWRFICDCGNVVEKRVANVKNGDTKSCGCLHKENAKKIGQTTILPVGESSFNGLYSSRKRGASERGYSWSISKELFRELISQPCHYCGAKPSQEYLSNKVSNGAYIYNGLDRVNNTIGYEHDNVVPCCGTCNIAKGTRTAEEFILWIQRVYEHLISHEQIS